MTCLAFDTSNYTTSCAALGEGGGVNVSRLLDVQPGQLGLRQSDALFAHVKRLPELTEQLAAELPGSITAIAASTPVRRWARMCCRITCPAAWTRLSGSANKEARND